MSTSYVSLQSDAESVAVDGLTKWRGVIKHSSLIWWAGPFEHELKFHAEEASRTRLHEFLDDLRNGELEA